MTRRSHSKPPWDWSSIWRSALSKIHLKLIHRVVQETLEWTCRRTLHEQKLLTSNSQHRSHLEAEPFPLRIKSQLLLLACSQCLCIHKRFSETQYRDRSMACKMFKVSKCFVISQLKLRFLCFKIRLFWIVYLLVPPKYSKWDCPVSPTSTHQRPVAIPTTLPYNPPKCL